jgi:hypothetical protein
MSESKSDRLGLRGTLAHYDSSLRLLGGANAAGAIAAGAAYNAFAQNVDVQNSVKAAAVIFLVGIMTFAIAYMFWFLTTLHIDHSLRMDNEPTWPDYVFWEPTKKAEQYRQEAKRSLLVVLFGGMISVMCFMGGLVLILMIAVRLQFG